MDKVEFAGVIFTNEEWEKYYEQIVQSVGVDYVSNEVNYVLDSAGRSWTLESWASRAFRTAVANDLLDSALNLADEFDQNLMYSTHVSDSSKLCKDWQNRIYWTKSPYKNYVNLEKSLWRGGGGLIHPNCRHKIHPYFEESELEKDVPSDKQVTANNKKREKYLYYGRQSRKWQDKDKVYKNANGVSNPEYTAKVTYYKKKQKELEPLGDLSFLI